MKTAMGNKVALIAMGCEKNVINSEQMLYLLDKAGYQLVDDPNRADVTVVNTCGFIAEARQEALEQIREIGGSKVILAGCMAEWQKSVPGRKKGIRADGYVGPGRFDDIVPAVEAVLGGRVPVFFGGLDEPVSAVPRIHMGPPHTAYIKIAEGCDNRCAYCLIPTLRGPYRSRKPEDVLAEAETLCRSGVTELVVIAQDVTRYGFDLPGGKPNLSGLLEKLCGIGGLRRIRLHYLYPELITDELIATVAGQEKIVKYLDIPMQHASDPVLKAMNRRYTRADLERLVVTLRERIPGVILRTTVIVGFPGETEDDFIELTDFLRFAKIPRVGVFAYSRETGTVAAGLPGQVPSKMRKRRQRVAEKLQSRITDAFNQSRVGSVAEVLCEGYDRYAGLYYGRSEAESPEVDGCVFFTSERKVSPGEYLPVLLEGALDGDGKGRAL
ncbi:MAG: 30S ribosomal protein S12 methylthiotransferase RimO [Oscillospiraceae bacterium]|jgi:ribosomal protein S12 methylthiotransferase|nr:30S ribosomal protein S12 methylthiotransferase RimO [Oscillospiraceae bacterium]